MQLFFHPLADNDHIVFSAEEAKHIKVLRKKEGDQIHCTNGEGLHSQFEIIAIEKNDIHCRNSEKNDFLSMDSAATRLAAATSLSSYMIFTRPTGSP